MQNIIDIRIMASPKRAASVNRILSRLELPDSCVTWDDRPNGGDAMYTARKTWLHPFPEGMTHRLVLQDDVDTCTGFIDIVQTIVDTHPDKVINLFNLELPNRYWDHNKTPYHQVTTLCGPAIIMPVDIIEPCMKWCEEEADVHIKFQDDLAIAEYCNTHDIMMLATFPNIVQHLGAESLINKDCKWNRKSRYYYENPTDDWTCSDIAYTN